mgnify:FL=1
MKVFVTGGTGFIGSHLVDKLLQNPSFKTVGCLIRNKEKWLKKREIVKYRGNLQNLKILKEGTQNIDTVFHLAAITRASSMRDFELHNVEATENLLRVAIKNGVSNIVVLSSLAATGPSFSRPVNEDDPLMPVSMYGKSKKLMEQKIHEIAADHPDVSIKIIRPPAVYGPRDEEIYSFFKMATFRLCPIVGDGNHPKISLVYVKDVTSALIRAASMKNPGVHTYFVAGQDHYSWSEIINATSVALNRWVYPVKLSSKWIKAAGKVIEKAAAPFGIYPVFNSEKAHEMTMQWTCSIKKAKKELNYEPRYTLQSGIAETISWYKKHHWL